MKQANAPLRLDMKHIPALDGLRAAAIFIIAWYHIWQQSWLSPTIFVHNDAGLLVRTISFEIWPRTGYLFVDLMLLLSAFCLFLPHARAMLLGDPVPNTRDFYVKRVCRILPSYWLCVLVLFFFSLFQNAWPDAKSAIKDLLLTLSFTQTFSAPAYLHSKINGVLWTAAIEMQFYLIFPLLAKWFRKKPLLTFLGLVAAQELYLRGFVLTHPDLLRFCFNQMPGFLGIFATGMMAAYLYIAAAKVIEGKNMLRALSCFSIAGFVLALQGIDWVQHTAASAENVQIIQTSHRLPLMFFFALLLLSFAFGGTPFRLVFGNRIMKFFAAISYNLYIWHQWLACRLKDWRIPYWEGTEYPNFTGNRPWQEKYTAVVFLVSIAVAVLLTYLVERPANRALLAIATEAMPPKETLDAAELSDADELIAADPDIDGDTPPFVDAEETL